MTIRSALRLWAALVIFIIGLPLASFGMGRIPPEAIRNAIEEKAPDFLLKDLQGRAFRLSEQRGKPVLLIFSATWCPSCRGEIPHLKGLYAAYAAKGLVMVNIDIQEKKEKVAPFAAKNKLPYRTLLDTVGDVATAYGVQGIPNLILVSRDGTILCRQCGSLDILLEKIFRKQ